MSDSRSRLRRIALQKGEPMPTFDKPMTPAADLDARLTKDYGGIYTEGILSGSKLLEQETTKGNK